MNRQAVLLRHRQRARTMRLPGRRSVQDDDIEQRQCDGGEFDEKKRIADIVPRLGRQHGNAGQHGKRESDGCCGD